MSPILVEQFSPIRKTVQVHFPDVICKVTVKFNSFFVQRAPCGPAVTSGDFAALPGLIHFGSDLVVFDRRSALTIILVRFASPD